MDETRGGSSPCGDGLGRGLVHREGVERTEGCRCKLLLAWMEVREVEGGRSCGCEGGRVDGGGSTGTGDFLNEGRLTAVWREFIGTGHFRAGRDVDGI